MFCTTIKKTNPDEDIERETNNKVKKTYYKEKKI